MPVVDVLVPQMGEGLQEVLIVEFFKNPGDRIARDEPFYSMETDKATMDVECPHDGTLVEWLASTGDTLHIGAPVCRMEVAVVGGEARPAAELRSIPPRTRAYARRIRRQRRRSVRTQSSIRPCVWPCSRVLGAWLSFATQPRSTSIVSPDKRLNGVITLKPDLVAPWSALGAKT